MVFRPRDQQTVYDSLKSRLEGRIERLNNWASTSFNNVWVDGFSEGLRENELQAFAAQLSGWVEYAGGPITQSDLDDLGAEEVTPEEINQYMEDQDLDDLVELVGIERDPGTRASGEVTVTTITGEVTIDEGTSFGTRPDERGRFFEFKTTSTVTSPDGDTSVIAPIEAVEVGEQYNVGASTITYMPDPPAGVRSVTNNADIDGGIDRETNTELRERAKEAVFATSGGGTANGVIGYIQQNTAAQDVLIEEFDQQQPPYADVIVDGGSDTEVEAAIAFSKPVGITHNLVRPTNYTVSVEVDVTGSDIESTRIEEDLSDHISGLGISEDLYRDKLFQVIFNSDEDVINTERMDVHIINEPHTYSTTQDIYQLDKGASMEQASNVDEVRGTLSGTSGHVFTEGTDYAVVDDSGNGDLDAIDWSIGGDNPDDGTDFYVDYEIEEDVPFATREKSNAGTMTVTVV